MFTLRQRFQRVTLNQASDGWRCCNHKPANPVVRQVRLLRVGDFAELLQLKREVLLQDSRARASCRATNTCRYANFSLVMPQHTQSAQTSEEEVGVFVGEVEVREGVDGGE